MTIRGKGFIFLLLYSFVLAETPQRIKVPVGLAEHVESFERSFKGKRYRKAIEELEAISLRYKGEVLPYLEGTCLDIPVSLFVLHSLQRLPDEVVEDYRRIIDPKATEVLEQYYKDYNRDHLEQIMRHFSLSSDAGEAIRLEAELDFEIGFTLSAGFSWYWLNKICPKHKDRNRVACFEAFVGVINGRDIYDEVYQTGVNRSERDESEDQLLGKLQSIQEELNSTSRKLVATVPERKRAKLITTNSPNVFKSSNKSVKNQFLRSPERQKKNPKEGDTSVLINPDYVTAIRQGTSLVAYDAQGKRLWDSIESAEGTENEELLQALQVISHPVSAEDSFVVSAVRISGEIQSLLISFAKKTGLIQWQKIIALSTDDRHLGLGRIPDAPVYKQGVLFVNTNSGVVAAIKNSTSDFLWISQYPEFKPGVLSRSIRFKETWNNEKMFFSHGYLVFAPQDATFLYIIDAITGLITAKIRRGSFNRINLLQNEALLVSGETTLSCLNLLTGKTKWIRENRNRTRAWEAKLRQNTLYKKEGGDYCLNDGELLGRRNHTSELSEKSRHHNVGHIDPDSSKSVYRFLPVEQLNEYDVSDQLGVSNSLALQVNRDRAESLQIEINIPEVFEINDVVMAVGDDLVKELLSASYHGFSQHYVESSIVGKDRVSQEIRDILIALKDPFRSKYLNHLKAEMIEAVIPEQVFAVLSNGGCGNEEIFSVAINWYEKKQWNNDIEKQKFEERFSWYITRDEVLLRHGDDELTRIERKESYLKLVVNQPDAFKGWYQKHALSTAKAEILNIGEQLIALGVRTVLSGIGSVAFMDYLRYGEILLFDKHTGQERCAISLDSGITARGDIVFSGDKMIVMERFGVTAYSLPVGGKTWFFQGNSKQEGGNEIQKDEFDGISVALANTVVVTKGGNVFCLSNSAGKVLWNFEFNSKSMHLIGVKEGKAIFLNKASLNFYALNLSDGSMGLRSHNTSSERTVFGGALIFNDSIVTYSHIQGVLGASDNSRGNVTCHSLKTGQETWRISTEDRIGALKFLPENQVMILPPTWAKTGIIDVYDGKSGKKSWSYENLNARCQGFYTGGEKVFVVGNKEIGSVLTCIDIKSGKQEWVRSLVNGGASYTLFERGELLCAYTQSTPHLFLFNMKTGFEYGNIPFKGRSHLEVRESDRGLLVCTEREIFELLIDGFEGRGLDYVNHLNELSEQRSLYGNNSHGGYSRGVYQAFDKARMHGSFEINKALLNINRSLQYRNAFSEKREIHISKLSKHIEVDGEMKDFWPVNARFPMKSLRNISLVERGGEENIQWRGENDLSGDLYMGWDSKHLYISVDVTDDIAHSFSSDSAMWKGDGLMIAIDPELDGGFGYNGRDYVFTQALMAKKPDKAEEEDGDQAEPEGQYAVRRRMDGSGTVYESAIPWKSLDRVVPSPGSRFGFNVFITDDDSGQGASKGLVLSPGISLDRRRSLFSRGYTPELFVEVVLDD